MFVLTILLSVSVCLPGVCTHCPTNCTLVFARSGDVLRQCGEPVQHDGLSPDDSLGAGSDSRLPVVVPEHRQRHDPGSGRLLSQRLGPQPRLQPGLVAPARLPRFPGQQPLHAEPGGRPLAQLQPGVALLPAHIARHVGRNPPESGIFPDGRQPLVLPDQPRIFPHVSQLQPDQPVLQPHVAVLLSHQPELLSHEPVLQPDKPELLAHQPELLTDKPELFANEPIIQPDQSELFTYKSKLFTDESEIFTDESVL